MAMAAEVPKLVSLENFNETAAKSGINSPRSIQACKQEGVLPQELLYRPIEAFQEKNLSPRLVKLRFDFFEAKRKDLLAAARRARETLLTEEKREKEVAEQQLDVISKESGLSRGAVLALKSDSIRQERKKLLKAQEIERNWLKNALQNELNQLKKLEQNIQASNAADDAEADRQQEISRRLKEVNDRRAAEEERKAIEAEARMKLEKQVAKKEFEKHLLDLEKKKAEDAVKQKEAYERQVKEMEKKKQAELEKERKREEAYREQEARKSELRANDLRRQEVREMQKQQFQQAMREKQEARDIRIHASIEKNQELELKRREDFEEKQRGEAIREERLMQARALEQEESAKRAFQLMMRRRVIQEEANRRMEDKRQAILDQVEDTEMRLLEHEQKKEKYLDFKKELDGLRSKNKEINVERQRRREEAVRENVAEAVRKKDDKIECMRSERERIYQIRRAAQTEAYRARELIKTEITRQRIRSKYNSKEVEKQLKQLMGHELFSPNVLTSSASMPLLKATANMAQANAAQN